MGQKDFSWELEAIALLKSKVKIQNSKVISDMMSGSIGIASEKVRKKEEVVREGKILEKCRYFPNFYTNDTNGHDMT